jgi:myosin heavy chain 9/10/11/14
VRNVDRIVKDLQTQVERKDKQNAQLGDDVARMRDKVDKLLKTIDELQASESSVQLEARRAERELREERERALRLEREVDSWRMRSERGSSVLGGSVAGSVVGYGSVRRNGTWRSGVDSIMGGGAGEEPEIPKRKSSVGRVGRQPSLTKGFL